MMKNALAKVSVNENRMSKQSIDPQIKAADMHISTFPKKKRLALRSISAYAFFHVNSSV